MVQVCSVSHTKVLVIRLEPDSNIYINTLLGAIGKTSKTVGVSRMANATLSTALPKNLNTDANLNQT